MFNLKFAFTKMARVDRVKKFSSNVPHHLSLLAYGAFPAQAGNVT
jgi:hypothetical protein